MTEERDHREVIADRREAQAAAGHQLGRAVLIVAGAVIALVVFVAIINGLSSDDSDVAEEAARSEVSASDYGEEWPLTVDHGTLGCTRLGRVGSVDLQAATFTAPDGTTYALNGTARSHTRHAEIRPIWADNPEFPGLKKELVLIEDALKLC
jgi:hypothetical protein